jgi:transketolase
MSNAAQSSVALAKRLRIAVVEMTSLAGASHVGSCLSCIDLLAVLYSEVMASDHGPEINTRDRLVMSKGHAAAALYACLAQVGLIDVAELATYCVDGSRLGGHVTAGRIPGVEFSTGSLGHGLPFAVGQALALKRSGSGSRVFVLMSDGELDEGTTWESLLFASHHGLNNLTVVIDRNGLQSFGSTEDTLRLEPLTKKFEAFGWDVQEIPGHNHEILRTKLLNVSSRPSAIIARTIKGKGVPFMEGEVIWHYRPPTAKDLAAAIAAIEGGHQ